MKKVLEENAADARAATDEKSVTTISGRAMRPLYRPEDVADVDYRTLPRAFHYLFAGAG